MYQYKLSKNEYILLRAIFNKPLHESIMNAGYYFIYQFLGMNSGEYDPETEIDIMYVTIEHIKQIRENNFSWTL